MEKNNVTVSVELTDNNYSAYIDILPGCISSGSTFDELKVNMQEAVEFHLQGMREDGEVIDKVFDDYQLIYKFDAQSLLQHYSGIFTLAALERLCGINQRQLQRYLSGESRPREEQRKKISSSLHRLAKELSVVEL